MSTKKQLSEDCKRFVVISLAMYESPSDVMDAVKDKFKVTLTRQGIQSYDPTKVAGRDLSEDLQKLFYDSRQKFDEDFAESLPLMKKHVRIKKLSKYAEAAENMGNYAGAASHIEQIAKEVGDSYSNKMKHDVDLTASVNVVRVPPKLSPEQWTQSQSKKS